MQGIEWCLLSRSSCCSQCWWEQLEGIRGGHSMEKKGIRGAPSIQGILLALGRSLVCGCWEQQH